MFTILLCVYLDGNIVQLPPQGCCRGGPGFGVGYVISERFGVSHLREACLGRLGGSVG